MKPLENINLNLHKVLISILGITFLSLSIYKASHTAFTHDESFTYLSYVKKSFIGIISMEEPVSANNHILNSLGMKVVDKILTPTPFHLRLPNIFGHLIFIVFSALLARNFDKNYFKIFVFILLNSNIYIIDLFSLARGYGLSLGFLMMHWYFLIKTFSNYNNKLYLRLMFFALICAVASNFSILYYAISFGIIQIIFLLKNKKEYKDLHSIWQSNKYFLIVSFALTVAFLYEPIRKLIKYKQLYFGGENNFFDDTIYSLVYYSSVSFKLNESQINVIYYVVLFIISLFIFSILIRIFKNKFYSLSSFFICSFILIIFIEIFFFYLFNTKYLIQRTAIFLIPLFTIALLSVLYEINTIILSSLIGIISIFTLYFTLKFIPLENSLNWGYDSDTEVLISDLNNIVKEKPRTKKLSLGIDWIFQPSLNFYRLTTNAGNWLDTLTKDGYENKNFDYYYVESNSLNKFVDTSKYKIIKTYSQSNNTLIKSLNFE